MNLLSTLFSISPVLFSIFNSINTNNAQYILNIAVLGFSLFSVLLSIFFFIIHLVMNGKIEHCSSKKTVCYYAVEGVR